MAVTEVPLFRRYVSGEHAAVSEHAAADIAVAVGIAAADGIEESFSSLRCAAAAEEACGITREIEALARKATVAVPHARDVEGAASS